MALACTLCGHELGKRWTLVGQEAFFRCPKCDLILRPPDALPTRDAERAHYDGHENDPADPRYRNFLDRCFAPLCDKLPPGAQGLDFGSGPDPAIPAMAAERGFQANVWDPFYTPNTDALDRTYDFLVATEVLEHLHHPAQTLDVLHRLVRPGGWLAVMTNVYQDDRPWAEWNYWRDLTHVCFYTPKTLSWIAESRNFDAETPHPNVRLWQVTDRPASPP